MAATGCHVQWLLLKGCDRMSCTVAFAAISTKLSLSRKTVKIVVAFPTQSFTGVGAAWRHQIAALSAATANALTTVLAGLAFTTTSLPNIIFLDAFVAGFLRVLILASPGIVKMPVFFTSA